MRAFLAPGFVGLCGSMLALRRDSATMQVVACGTFWNPRGQRNSTSIYFWGPNIYQAPALILNHKP